MFSIKRVITKKNLKGRNNGGTQERSRKNKTQDLKTFFSIQNRFHKKLP